MDLLIEFDSPFVFSVNFKVFVIVINISRNYKLVINNSF